MNDDIFEEAANSVERRGFLSIDPPGLTGNGDVMAQYVRTGEEYGELGRALRKFDGDYTDIENELADVIIAGSTLGRTLNIDLNAAIRRKLTADERRGRLHGEA